ncbi:MAG: GGDEF domain-containing protein, partial [Pseudomonas sp.]
YLLAWLLTWLCGDAPGAQLGLGLLGSAFFALLFALRLLHGLPAGEAAQPLQRWIDRHWVLLLLTALGWGLVQGWVLRSPEFQASRMVALISTIAFSTALGYNFPMRKGRALLAIMLFYLPGLLVLATDWDGQRAVLITLLLYLSHLLLALDRSHREYRDTLALELQLLEQRGHLEQLSRTDSLTQLGNRYQFNNLFPAMVASAQRQGGRLSLVLLDIDFFKRVNDEHGHVAGDACLQAFAERMRQVFRRDSDALLRLGGEEFGVLLPDTALEQARQLAEDFRRDLARNGFAVQDELLPLTASLGVGCFDARRDASAEAFFKRVDDALYRAKAAGRDCLVLAQVEVPTKA